MPFSANYCRFSSKHSTNFCSVLFLLSILKFARSGRFFNEFCQSYRSLLALLARTFVIFSCFFPQRFGGPLRIWVKTSASSAITWSFRGISGVVSSSSLLGCSMGGVLVGTLQSPITDFEKNRGA